jgi:endoglucanase
LPSLPSGPRRRLRAFAALGLGLAAVTAATGTASAASADHANPSPATRFFIPPPNSGALTQIGQLLKAGDFKDAALLTEMITTPQAVWFTGGTPAQVQQQVRTTIAQAAFERAVPVIVAYDIPGRDCAQFSAGGALSQADYQAWIDALSAGIGHARAVVLVEPDGLGNLPSDCHLPASVYPFTDTDRFAEINYAVGSLAKNPNASVYLDGTHSAWQSVGTMTQRLLEGGVQQARGFYLDVSNYQPTPELADYGTWISDCIAMVTDPANWAFGLPADCASQYFPATQSDFSTWGLTTQWYAANMGTAVASTHFVVDTSRNGQGPNSMQSFAAAPFNQPSAVISKLASGNWCNPPGSGLGLRPTSATGVPLLDAYLWVKIPGESDGQCDAAGGVRAWDYTAYTLPSWPTDPAAQQVFDPLWGMNDPAAGAWFPQQALQLAQDAQPSLF